MFEYAIRRYYLDVRGKLVKDDDFDEMIFDDLEEAVAKEALLTYMDTKGIYYVEHRVKFNYARSN